jgi:hypothetical protein
MLFLAGKHSYVICRKIAEAARDAGFDGINYPSYFSMLPTGLLPFETQYGLSNRLIARHFKHDHLAEYETAKMVPNLALFGRPIKDGVVEVRGLNRLALRQVAYNGNFGPISP